MDGNYHILQIVRLEMIYPLRRLKYKHSRQHGRGQIFLLSKRLDKLFNDEKALNVKLGVFYFYSYLLQYEGKYRIY